MDNRIARLIEVAYALREKNSSGGRNFHVSAIFKKSKLISLGLNNYSKTHPRTRDFGYPEHCRIHSELAACLKLGLSDCSGLTIVNVRIDRNGNLANSKYCRGCTNLVKHLNFSKAFYTNDYNGIEQL